MQNYGLTTFLYLRSDAGSNFISDEFKKWCDEMGVTLTIAGPKHQEQNGFAESAYRVANEMARSLLVQAHLPLSFLHLALDYACLIMRVLPTKNLLKSEKKLLPQLMKSSTINDCIFSAIKSLVVQWYLSAINLFFKEIQQQNSHNYKYCIHSEFSSYTELSPINCSKSEFSRWFSVKRTCYRVTSSHSVVL